MPPWIDELPAADDWTAGLPQAADVDVSAALDQRMKRKATQPNSLRPEAPDDLEGDALSEWHRVCEAAEQVGHPIREADRSILATYCRTWVVNQSCFAHIKKFGPVVVWPNGMPGPSPQAKMFEASVKLLRGLLADLGCTPSSRNFDVSTTPPKTELNF
jgi:P27 family predicted phage terminase small subunit